MVYLTSTKIRHDLEKKINNGKDRDLGVVALAGSRLATLVLTGASEHPPSGEPLRPGQVRHS